MDLVHPRCAGIDISKRDAKLCVRIASSGRARAISSVTTWGAVTSQILALRDHLVAAGKLEHLQLDFAGRSEFYGIHYELHFRVHFHAGARLRDSGGVGCSLARHNMSMPWERPIPLLRSFECDGNAVTVPTTTRMLSA